MGQTYLETEIPTKKQKDKTMKEVHASEYVRDITQKNKYFRLKGKVKMYNTTLKPVLNSTPGTLSTEKFYTQDTYQKNQTLIEYEITT